MLFPCVQHKWIFDCKTIKCARTTRYLGTVEMINVESFIPDFEGDETIIDKNCCLANFTLHFLRFDSELELELQNYNFLNEKFNQRSLVKQQVVRSTIGNLVRLLVQIYCFFCLFAELFLNVLKKSFITNQSIIIKTKSPAKRVA